MNGEVFIPIAMFLVVGLIAVSYYYFRFKERQIMLEKGLTPEQMLELTKVKKSNNILLKVGIISIAFGIGLGAGIAIEENYDFSAAVPFFIFVATGIGFVLAFVIDKKYYSKD